MRDLQTTAKGEPELHYLVAVLGLSPAVLTETIYGLAQQSEPDLPDRVIVVTTRQGREACQRVLFDGGAWGALVQHIADALGLDTSGRLQFGPTGDSVRLIPSADRSHELDDVTTTEDSRAAGDFLLETLGTLCGRERVRVTASVAGGRKSMGALLLSALSFAGRPHDRAVHVLVSEPWERIPSFTFPGCRGHFRCPASGQELNSQDARVSLADVPFVPLRQFFEREWQRFPSDLYRLADEIRERATALDGEALELYLDTARGSMRVNAESIPVSPLEFALIATLARRTQEGKGELPQYLDLYEPLMAFAQCHHQPDDFAHWTHTILESPPDPKEAFRRAASSLRSKLARAGLHRLQIDRLVPTRNRLSLELSAAQIHFSTLPADRPAR